MTVAVTQGPTLSAVPTPILGPSPVIVFDAPRVRARRVLGRAIRLPAGSAAG